MTNHARRSQRRRTQGTIAALTIISVLALAACGDDDEQTTEATAAAAVATTEAPAATTMSPATTEASDDTADNTDAPAADIAPEYAAYCEAAAELDAQDEFPSDDQLEELRAAAPDEISAEINTVADALIEAEDPMLVFSDPVIGAAFGPIEEFEAANCGLHSDDEEEAQDPSVTEIDPDATRVDLAGTDFAFGGTLPEEAGRYSFVMQNAGETVHMMILVKLEEGATLDEALESQGDAGVAEEYSSDDVLPGEEAVVTADLTPGNWVLLCPIPTPEGPPHFVEGMIQEFTIT